tara:strand:+ start:1151 stop:3067 length:1917 start_codon:yes stop_codon:yes gene_type:complete
MKKLEISMKNYTLAIISLIMIAACGGGGGGSDSPGSGYTTPTNNPPSITNTNMNISVVENQTAAFTVNATDPNGDTLTYSLSGDDASLLTITNQGVVTFITAPDFEDPSDSDTNNVYKITVTVTDGSLSANANFEITVTNDTSDDVTTSNYDGTLVMSGPIQSATICLVESLSTSCSDASSNTVTAQDGTFSLTVDSNAANGIIKSEGGFDPNTNWEIEDQRYGAIGEPTTEQNFVISPASTLLYEYDNNTSYETFKTNLGIDDGFMIRTDNPFESLSSNASNKAAVVYSQLLVLNEVLNEIHTYDTNSSEWYLTKNILERSGNYTSLGDTTFIKNLLSNLDDNFSPSSSQLVSLSAGISSFLQKIYADSSNTHSYFTKVGIKELEDLMEAVMNNTADINEIDKLTFNTIDWINENTSWEGGSITDNEQNIVTTTYSLSNEGSSNYLVDQVNTSNTDFIIYVKEGDIIKFDATSSVTSNHPFLLSTEVDDRDDSAQIGTNEGWDKDTLTLTVSANTPDEIYPYCDFHAGMYTRGKIVKVDNYNVTNLDVTNASGALQVKGTVATGPFKGASGFTYKVYLTRQDSSDHEHTFYEYPNLTFYMPNDQGYHGSENASTDELFKPKSHYVASSGTSESDDGY